MGKMMTVRHIDDAERRARLVTRHGIAPETRFPTPSPPTRAMTVLHATEPATVYLSLAARVDGLTVAAIERELYDRRTLVKQLAMRRTAIVLCSRDPRCPRLRSGPLGLGTGALSVVPASPRGESASSGDSSVLAGRPPAHDTAIGAATASSATSPFACRPLCPCE
jgi:hypothetical protein